MEDRKSCKGRKYRRRHRRKRKVRLFLRGIFLVCMCLVLINIGTEIGRSQGISFLGKTGVSEMEPYFEAAGEEGDVLRELYENNPETEEFIRNYERLKDSEPADHLDELKQGEIPLLLQWDERWGYAHYGDSILAVNGCGPTSLAMVIAGLTRNADITPYKIAQFAEEKGYYEGDAGTSWLLMSEGAGEFGMTSEELSLNKQVIEGALENGNPVICSMKPGDFTTTGHFIVLTGMENGRICLNDPNSIERSEKLWDYEELEPQINNLWMYTVTAGS